MGLFLAGCLLACGAPAAPVEVIRDRFGVPHIFGATLADVAYAQGYCHAQDNLELVLANLAGSRGKSSFGPGGGRGSQELDFLVLAFHLPEIARNCYEAYSVEERGIVDSYAAGVEKYLSENTALRPDWLGRITGADILAVTKLFQLQQSISVAKNDLSGKSKESAERELTMLMDRTGGSNMWALAPSRTTDGATRLMSDPHLSWFGGTKWHEAQLVVAGKWIHGAIFPGTPGVGIGFTENLAWGFTNNGADLADVYRLKLNPKNPDQYLYEGKWRDVRTESVTLTSRAPDGSVKTVVRTARYSHHGPILREDRKSNEAFAVRIAGWEGSVETLDWVLRFRAKDLTGFETALDRGHGYKWNCIAADSAGNIGYYYLCAARQRDESLRWNAPVDGSVASTEWGRMLTWRDLPHLVNPKAGYLQNCNNSAFTVTRDCELKPGTFPTSFGSQGTVLGPETRAYRAIELIEARPRHDSASFSAITFDVKSLIAGQFIEQLLSAEESAGRSQPDPSGRRAAALQRLRDWDGFATVENLALPILAGYLQAAQAEDLSYGKIARLPAPRVLELLDKGLALLRKRWGEEPVTWGRLHVIHRGNLEIPVPGGGSERGSDPFLTLFMVGAKQVTDGKYYADSGSSWLQSVAYRNGGITAETVLPFGNSNDPQSPHYNDQAPLYAAMKMKPVKLTRSEIEADATSRLVLNP